jgi:hypothetical protein
MKSFALCVVFAIIVCQGKAQGDGFDVSLETLNVEVKSIAPAGLGLRVNFIQAGATLPALAIGSIQTDANVASLDDLKAEFDQQSFLPDGCSFSKTPTAMSGSSGKYTAVGIEITCTGTGDIVKSVIFNQAGMPDLAGVCVPVPVTSQLLPTVKFIVTSKLVPAVADIEAYVLYTAAPTPTAFMVELTPTIKLPFLNAVAPTVDPAKAGTFFTGFASATGDVATAMSDAFNGLVSDPQAIEVAATFSDQPCIVIGTRSIGVMSDYSVSSSPVTLVTFNWNGLYASNVVLGGSTGGGGGEMMKK